MSPASELLLQQICDSVFPIGAYSHSFGLETFIQLGIVRDADSAAAYVADQIAYPLTYTELLGMRLGYEAARHADMDALVALELELQALKTPTEPRAAMNKLAARFIRTVSELEVLDPEVAAFFSGYAASQRDHAVNVAYGVLAALADIDLAPLMHRYLYSQVSAIVVNCVKTVPLSQTAGQQIITGSFSAMETACDTALSCEATMLGLSCPGFDTRCIEHETLYSRLYMS